MPNQPDPDRVEQRAAELLPEEQSADVDDATSLARAVLADSDVRTDHREDDDRAAPSTVVEHRRSEDTVDPGIDESSRG